MSDEREKRSPDGIIWASLAVGALPVALALTCWVGVYLTDVFAPSAWYQFLALASIVYEWTLPVWRLLGWYLNPWIP